MAQDCVEAAIVSDAFPQDFKSFLREFEAKMFCCLSPQNPLMCEEERIFPKFWYD